ncbi:MAG: hemerythrin domain-containing protein [Candidatus Sericytochromatia bacterium]|nr:hemerythrin domain-containing protein [Candidatus Sericytochromatia bacterium]
MMATDLLKKQHRKAEELFKKLEKGGRMTAGTLDDLATDLIAHMAIENEIFYPAVRSVQPDLIAEAIEEHAVAEFELKRLIATNPKDKAFAPRLKVLQELIEHHVEEEERDLFPKIEKALGGARSTELVAAMQQRFKEIKADDTLSLLFKGAKSADERSRAADLATAT